jgi:hypothetical protein
MLLGFDREDRLAVVGAHHIEPGLSPDVGYTEVIAVARDARGVLVALPDGDQLSLDHFMMLTIFQQMRPLGRHPRTFVRVDRCNTRSLAPARSRRLDRRTRRPAPRPRAALGRSAVVRTRRDRRGMRERMARDAHRA